MNEKVVKWLEGLHACPEAVEWVAKQTTTKQAWQDCKRGDWMLWLLGKLSGKPGSAARKNLVLAACGCARLSLKYVSKGEERPRIAIEKAEKWAHGKATLDEVRDAAYAAADSADYADDAYAAYAAYAAAANAAYAAANAAYAAANAAYAAYADADAKTKTFAKCADIVRKHYPTPPRMRG
jgi:hypothetical protein